MRNLGIVFGTLLLTTWGTAAIAEEPGLSPATAPSNLGSTSTTETPKAKSRKARMRSNPASAESSTGMIGAPVGVGSSGGTAGSGGPSGISH